MASTTPLLAESTLKDYGNTSTMNDNKSSNDQTEEIKHTIDDDIMPSSDSKSKRIIPDFSVVKHGESIVILLHIRCNDAVQVYVDGVEHPLFRFFDKGSRLYDNKDIDKGHCYSRIICKELPKVIKICDSESEKVLKTINYGDIVWSKEEEFGGTQKRKFIAFTDFDCILYEEHFNVTWRGVGVAEWNEDSCKIFANFKPKYTYRSYTEFSDLSVNKASNSHFDLIKNNEFQIYYLPFYNLVFAVATDVAEESKSFGNTEAFGINAVDRSELRGTSHTVLREKYSHLGSLPFYKDNITEPIWMYLRYKWLSKECLYGMDSEFNIFRSLCFVDSDYRSIRIALGISCVILQVFLTIGIVFEVVNNWKIEDMFDNETMIMTISFLVFSFISFLYTITAKKYFQFYTNMYFVCEIPWFFIILDFISNILIGLIICLVSLFYLLQSETISDVVLNSFALTFVIELDDLANIYESDEDKLLQQDMHLLFFQDYDDQIRKRRITVFGRRDANYNRCRTFGMLLATPFTILYAIWIITHGMVKYFKTKARHNIKKRN